MAEGAFNVDAVLAALFAAFITLPAVALAGPVLAPTQALAFGTRHV